MGKIRKIMIISIAIMITFLFVGCTTDAQEQAYKKPIVAKGFFWKATKDDKSVYLIGTMHPDKSNINYLNSNMEKVLNETDALALEINFSDENVQNEIEKLDNESTYLKNGELKDLLTQAENEKLEKILESLDLKYEDVKNLTPEAILNLITSEIYTRAGYTGTTSDMYLQNIYNSNKKKIVSLEAIEEQEELTNLTNSDLKDFIKVFNAKTIESDIKDVNEVMYAFIKGDSKFMEERVDNQYEQDKEKYNKILKDRNIKMANKIDELAKENDKYAIAVGTLHFFGKDSIIKQLEDKGYKVNKLKS
ncbi:MAG: TraB/GumN family protein [Paraclostridium sp.]|uniref:TraB/GumN family protein n=1 Tax=Paraclostridium sp. TaxID=2023273 RepID=UPI003F325209